MLSQQQSEQSVTTEMCPYVWIEYARARTSFITFYARFCVYCVSVNIATVINIEENIAHVQYI